MRISCPHCGATGDIRDTLIPEAGKTIVCPRCQGKFPVKREASHAPPVGTAAPSPTPPDAQRIPVNCPACGASGTIAARLIPPGGKTVTCPKCKAKIPVKRESQSPPVPPGGEVPFRCPKCNREGTIAAALIPQGGGAINCPDCGARFYVRGPYDATAQTPPPGPRTAGPLPIEPASHASVHTGIVGSSIGGPGALSPAGPTHRASPAFPSRTPRSPSSGETLALDDIWSRPSIRRAVLGGISAAFIGALVWTFITVMTSYQIGLMAIGVGALVGFAVRFFGRGQDIAFGIVGGGLAMFGCMIGNLMASCAFISADPRNAGIGFMSILFDALASPTTAYRIMAGTFQPIDIIFYLLAVSAGYKTALKSE